MFAFNQTIQRKIDPKAHVNVLDPLLKQLRKRTDVVYLKRLTIVLDEESEKGFGLVRIRLVAEFLVTQPLFRQVPIPRFARPMISSLSSRRQQQLSR